LRFASALGGNAPLELDVNYMARQPLFGAVRMPSTALGEARAEQVLVLDLHEIVAGKLAALFDRHQHATSSMQGASCLSTDSTGRRSRPLCSPLAPARVAIGERFHPRELRQELMICLPRGYSRQQADNNRKR
jgi:hypothetical protein